MNLKQPFLILAVGAFFCVFAISARSDQATITIDAAKPVGPVSPTLYGLMTEEINHAYDGGLYAELVQNRAFLDDTNTPVHWSGVPDSASTISLDATQPLNSALPVSLRLDATNASASSPMGIANDGYWGIPVKPNTRYHASFYARAAAFSGRVTVSIQSDDGKTIYAEAKSRSLSTDWKQFDVTLKTGRGEPTTHARLVLSVNQPGTIWFSLVSLFPPTWDDQPNGFRPDIMQMLIDMKPQFLRFPGGNYLEGDHIASRFDWKKTLGPISERHGHPGPWGYRSTDGMGLMEFLRWCEDMRAEPVLAVYAGYSFREKVKAGPALDPFVQDALDEIEYVTGDKSTKWGAERAKDGHPAPFKLHYVEIGNEDFLDRSLSYDGRFAQFYDAIKAKYPQLACISTVGNEQPSTRHVKSRTPDVLDEHYYRNYGTFISNAPAWFESYDRTGPKIFVGEWGAYESVFPPWDKRSQALKLPPTPSMQAALGDAAWMTAMERNSDVIAMQCYAPLFVNVNSGAWQWRPNLIGYDGLHSYGSPSYYAFCLFSHNVGDEILKATVTDSPVQTSVTRDSQTGKIYVKLVNPAASAQNVKLNIQGITTLAPNATVLTLCADPEATNSLEEPKKVVPVSSEIHGLQPAFNYSVPAHSITVLILQSHS